MRRRRSPASPLLAGDASAARPRSPKRQRRSGQGRGRQEEARSQAQRAPGRKKRDAERCRSDVADIAAEREQINARLVETAALVQKSEAQLTAIEARLGELEEQEKDPQGSLAQRYDQIPLLAALQRMGRNPPPVMITRREDALKMVRSAMLLAAPFPRCTPGHGAHDKAQRARARDGRHPQQGDQLRSRDDAAQRHAHAARRACSRQEAHARERQSELKQVRKAAAESRTTSATSTSSSRKLDQEVKDNTGSAPTRSEQRKTAAPANITPDQLRRRRPSRRTRPPRCRPSPKAPRRSARAPVRRRGSKGRRRRRAGARVATLGSPGRIKPAIAFPIAKGKLPMPAQGRRVLSFGEKTQYRRPIEGSCARNASRRPSHVTLRRLDCLRWRISQLWATLDHQRGRRLSCAARWPVADRCPTWPIRSRRRAGRNDERLRAQQAQPRSCKQRPRPLRGISQGRASP